MQAMHKAKNGARQLSFCLYKEEGYGTMKLV